MNKKDNIIYDCNGDIVNPFDKVKITNTDGMRINVAIGTFISSTPIGSGESKLMLSNVNIIQSITPKNKNLLVLYKMPVLEKINDVDNYDNS